MSEIQLVNWQANTVTTFSLKYSVQGGRVLTILSDMDFANEAPRLAVRHFNYIIPFVTSCRLAYSLKSAFFHACVESKAELKNDTEHFKMSLCNECSRYQLARCLMRGSAAVRLLRLRVRIPPGVMEVCMEVCLL